MPYDALVFVGEPQNTKTDIEKALTDQVRQALFISHASPEDNAFTLWLGAKLAALGYEVFADVLRLKGGDDWERVLENAIREKAE
jgi:TIR domain